LLHRGIAFSVIGGEMRAYALGQGLGIHRVPGHGRLPHERERARELHRDLVPFGVDELGRVG